MSRIFSDSSCFLKEQRKWENAFMPLKVTDSKSSPTIPFFANFGSYFEGETCTDDQGNIVDKITAKLAADVLSDYIQSETPKKSGPSMSDSRHLAKTASGNRSSINPCVSLQVIPQKSNIMRRKIISDKSQYGIVKQATESRPKLELKPKPHSRIGGLKPAVRTVSFEKNIDK